VIPLNEAPADREYATLAQVNPDTDIFVTSANAQAKAAGTPPTVVTNLTGNTGLYTTDKSKWPSCDTGFSLPQMCSDIVAGASPALMADGAEADTRGLEEWSRMPFFTGSVPADEDPYVEVLYDNAIQAKAVRLSAGDRDKKGGWITDARVEVRSVDGVTWRTVPVTPERPIDPVEAMQEVELLFPGVSEITGVRVTFAPWSDHLNIAEIDAIAPSQFAATALSPNPAVPLDLDELKAVIASVAWLDGSQFTGATWAAVESAVTSARTLIDGAVADPTSVSISEATGAVARLRAAIVGLAAPQFPDESALARAEVAAALAELAGKAQAAYTAATWAPFATAKAAAATTLADPAATLEQLRSVLTRLSWATQALKTPADAAPTPAPTVTIPGPAPTVVVTLPASDPSTAPSDGGKPLTLKEVPLGATGTAMLSVPQTTLRLVKGSSAKVRATAFDAEGQALKATWKSSKPNVAKVTAAGKVTAAKAGTATLTVKSGALSAKIKVTVVAKKPAAKGDKVTKVTVTKLPASMAVGQVAWVKVKATPASATKAVASFASSNSTVASVDQGGRIVARAPGKATITVAVKGKAVTKTITVK
jgi:uncharacterized protein YjdB